MGIDTFLPALGISPELAVLASAFFATTSVVMNFYSGQILEKQRAQLTLELERDKALQQQITELQGVIARYRGPLLESAIDLEQRLWHLAADSCFDNRSEDETRDNMRYLLFTMAQFLGFVEVVRRESPRERSFLQSGSPQGADTLSTLVEGIRFVLAASPAYLEQWYLEGHMRGHPGSRRRKTREEVIDRHILEMSDPNVCPFSPEEDLWKVSRGHQRAIGTYMIITKMGAQRHYTQSYGEFHKKLEHDPEFRLWFRRLETDATSLALGKPWQGEGPFPVGRWTRVLLLQQLLVELIDLLDPDLVRMPLDRRVRLCPIAWGPLPQVGLYQKRLQELSVALDFGKRPAKLEGAKELLRSREFDEGPLTSSLRSALSVTTSEEDENGVSFDSDGDKISSSFSSSSSSSYRGRT